MTKEIIYVLTNEAMEGYVKIGKTTNLNQRLNSLDNTSVPLPFECVFAIEVEQGQCERLVHDAFADARVRKNREFFEISPDRIMSALRLTGGREIELSSNESLDEEAKDALLKAKKRRDRFSFKMVDIPVGAELEFYKQNLDGNKIVCTVDSNNKVLYQDELLSLSASAMRAVNDLGFDWVTISGPASWCYEGETLDQRRQRFESE
jgi:hypothetical protein